MTRPLHFCVIRSRTQHSTQLGAATASQNFTSISSMVTTRGSSLAISCLVSLDCNFPTLSYDLSRTDSASCLRVRTRSRDLGRHAQYAHRHGASSWLLICLSVQCRTCSLYTSPIRHAPAFLNAVCDRIFRSAVVSQPTDTSLPLRAAHVESHSHDVSSRAFLLRCSFGSSLSTLAALLGSTHDSIPHTRKSGMSMVSLALEPNKR